MSDDLMIQGVNPQIQPQRVSTVPYALGGAALGGVGAYAATSLKKGGEAKSYEELIKEANENDKVELKSKKEALEKAEKELAEAGKAVYDGAEKTALDDAIKARDAELEKLTGTTSSAEAKEFKPKDWGKAGIKASELPTTNERTGKPFHTDRATAWEKEVEREYNRLVADYNRAVTDLDARLGSGDSKKLNDTELKIKNYLNDVKTRRAKTSINALDSIFVPEEPSWRSGFTARKTEFTEADKMAAKIYPQVKNVRSLTPDQIKSFAEKLEDGARRPSGHKYAATVNEVVDGKVKKVKYTFSDDMFKDFKETENKRLIELQKELRESLLNSAKEHIILSRKDANFTKEFIESIPDGVAKKSGVLDGAGKLDIAKINTESGGKPRFYKKDLSLINQAIEKNGGAYKKLPAGLRGNYAGAKDLQAALDMANTRKQLVQDFNTERNALTKDLEACWKEHSVLTELREKIADKRNADEGVQKAKEALFRQFPSLSDGTVEKAGLTAEQAMEKDSYKRLAKIVEEKQAAYDKVLAEKGKINEGAKKAAEDAVTKAKGELDSVVKDLGGKIGGMSTKAKLAWAAGTAVVGGLIGAGIANSKNKKAEAEAAQNIYA